jgi:hypothetical protein
VRVAGAQPYPNNFKTQLLALGVQPDFVDYMMGHTVDPYHDIQMKEIDFLRNISAASGLAIKPKTRVSKIEALKRPSAPKDSTPSRSSPKRPLSQPAAVRRLSADYEDSELQILSKTLHDSSAKEAVKTTRP